MPPEIQRLTGQFLHNPVRVEVARPATTAATIAQTLVPASDRDFEKRDTLRRLLVAPELKNAIIFCNRKRSVVELHRSLLRHNFSVAALHGDMDQPSRMRALDGFRQGTTKFLVASDVAARGLDIPAVSHIFNFDVPHHSEDYVHRIGRTGRAGLEGTAITLVAPSDTKSLDAIERLIGQPIPWSGAPVQPAQTPDAISRPSQSRKPRPERSRSKASSGRRAPLRPDIPAPEPVPVPEPAARAVHDRQQQSLPEPASPARPAHAQPRRARPDAEPAVLGLGDHVPSFLLRPVRTGA
jgi:superfamily II DNA/RNA helicase